MLSEKYFIQTHEIITKEMLPNLMNNNIIQDQTTMSNEIQFLLYSLPDEDGKVQVVIKDETI